jgi:hypothetical protein
MRDGLMENGLWLRADLHIFRGVVDIHTITSKKFQSLPGDITLTKVDLGPQ